MDIVRMKLTNTISATGEVITDAESTIFTAPYTVDAAAAESLGILIALNKFADFYIPSLVFLVVTNI